MEAHLSQCTRCATEPQSVQVSKPAPSPLPITSPSCGQGASTADFPGEGGPLT